MDGLEWETLLKWMIWEYHYFWKHPYGFKKRSYLMSECFWLMRNCDKGQRVKLLLWDVFALRGAGNEIGDVPMALRRLWNMLRIHKYDGYWWVISQTPGRSFIQSINVQYIHSCKNSRMFVAKDGWHYDEKTYLPVRMLRFTWHHHAKLMKWMH